MTDRKIGIADHPYIEELLSRIDAIERRVGLGKYAPVSPTHGERVIARKKYDGHDTYLNGNPDMEQWVHDNK